MYAYKPYNYGYGTITLKTKDLHQDLLSSAASDHRQEKAHLVQASGVEAGWSRFLMSALVSVPHHAAQVGVTGAAAWAARLVINSAARWACHAAVNSARLSAASTFSQVAI
jgi:hypothetical protein